MLRRLFSKRSLLFFFTLFLMLLLYQFAKSKYEAYQHQQYVAGLKHTASENVQVLPDTVLIDYLSTKRTLRIYLPPNYAEDTVHYPVIYFLDGPSLFDEKVLEGPELQVDEVMDSVATLGGPMAIVIGIDDSKDRNTEYTPFTSPRIRGETEVSGGQHAEWIATDLKDWVDERYRTIKDADHTTIGGASLGGLMAYYMIMTYPQVFGNAIVFSPSFWVNNKVFDLHKQVEDFRPLKIYLNIGEYEGEPMIPDAQKMYDILKAAGMAADQLRFDIVKGEGHSHPTWRKGFRAVYPWILE